MWLYLHLWSETTNLGHSPCENQGKAPDGTPLRHLPIWSNLGLFMFVGLYLFFSLIIALGHNSSYKSGETCQNLSWDLQEERELNGFQERLAWSRTSFSSTCSSSNKVNHLMHSKSKFRKEKAHIHLLGLPCPCYRWQPQASFPITWRPKVSGRGRSGWRSLSKTSRRCAFQRRLIPSLGACLLETSLPPSCPYWPSSTPDPGVWVSAMETHLLWTLLACGPQRGPRIERVWELSKHLFVASLNIWMWVKSCQVPILLLCI